MRASALIPAKGFAKAKQRLAPLLSARERKVLAESMLRNVLHQVLSTRGVETTFVVTADDEVTRLAISLGAQVIREQEEKGETEAVTFALWEMQKRGIQAVLVLPGDLPLLCSGDIEFVLDQVPGEISSAPFALMMPSWDRMGTNALLLSPPDVIRLRFGYDSFCYHLSEASAKRLPLKILENERIALDIDESKDLENVRLAGLSDEICGGSHLTIG